MVERGGIEPRTELDKGLKPNLTSPHNTVVQTYTKFLDRTSVPVYTNRELDKVLMSELGFEPRSTLSRGFYITP